MKNCIRDQTLVEQVNIYFNRHYTIKLVNENFVKVLNKFCKCFGYVREKVPKLSDAKLQQGTFIGPQIRKIVNDELFERLLKESEKSAQLTFIAVCLHFLGNLRSENYKKIVEEFLNAYQTLECNICHRIFIFYISTSASSLGTWAQ
jgi:hypothetical protein